LRVRLIGLCKADVVGHRSRPHCFRIFSWTLLAETRSNLAR
jgi:hypothetical protein